MSNQDERQEPVLPDATIAVDEDERERRERNPAAEQKVRIAGRRKPARRSRGPDDKPRAEPVLLALVAAGVIAYLVWATLEHRQRSEQMQWRLEAASQRIDALEGELSSTGETLSESGSAVEGKLKTLEHEVRKLWDISNKRNRKWIEDNQAALEELQKANGGLQQSISTDLAEVRKSLEGVRSERKQESEAFLEIRSGLDRLPALEKGLETVKGRVEKAEASSAAGLKEAAKGRAGLEAELKKVDESLLSMQARSDQLGAQLTRLKTELSRLEQQVAASGGGADEELAALRKAIAANDQAVRSIDAFRRQTNQSITSLQSAVSTLQKHH